MRTIRQTAKGLYTKWQRPPLPAEHIGCTWVSSNAIDPEFDDMDGSEIITPVDHRARRILLLQKQQFNGRGW